MITESRIEDQDIERLRAQAEFMAICERPMPNGQDGDWRKLTQALDELQRRRTQEDNSL